MTQPVSSFRAAIRNLFYAIVTPGALPPIVWGPPGVGKSSVMEAIAAAMHLPLRTVIASICDPTDFGGVYVPDGDRLKRLAMSWAVELAQAGEGIAFIDEMSTAPPAVQAALLRPLLDGVVGDLVLPRWRGDVRDESPRGVKFVAAANPPEQAAGGHELSDPTANRFIHLAWPAPSAEDWGAWAMGDGAMESLPRFNVTAWERQLPKSRALAAAFLRRRPELLSEDVTKARGRFPMAYATPRTWDTATRLHATCVVLHDLESAPALLAGAIGAGAAAEFLAYVDEHDLPDPDDLLDGKVKFVPDPARPDRTFAVLLMLCAAATTKQAKQADYNRRWNKAWELLGPIVPQGKDLVVVGARMLAKARPRGEGSLLNPAVQTIIADLVDVVREAGIGGAA